MKYNAKYAKLLIYGLLASYTKIEYILFLYLFFADLKSSKFPTNWSASAASFSGI